MIDANCVRVNSDYELMLFHRQNGSPAMNFALEYLAFFLQELPILTAKEYSPSYLRMISELTGKNPKTVRQGKPLNWWGPLLNLEREKWLNSKLTSFALSLNEGWTEGKILSREEIFHLNPERPMIVKDPFNMSGKGMIVIRPGEAVHLPAKMQGQLIVEPYLKRTNDFSHFVFPDGRVICYENLVDEKFQYKGTLFSSFGDFSISSLSFFQEVMPQKWTKFEEHLAKIIHHYGDDALYGYSIDSFIHEVASEKEIYPLCEVNARRTMGLMAFELGNIFQRKGKVALSLKAPIFSDAVKISPDDVLFDVFLSFG